MTHIASPGVDGDDDPPPWFPLLKEAVRHAIRTRQYAYRTEEAYQQWIRRFAAFHGWG